MLTAHGRFRAFARKGCDRAGSGPSGKRVAGCSEFHRVYVRESNSALITRMREIVAESAAKPSDGHAAESGAQEE